MPWSAEDERVLSRFASFLRARQGWRRLTAAFAFGCVCALAYAPTNLFPVLWISFPAIIFLMQGVPNWRAAFATGWCFAFGLFVCGLYWIAASMFVDIAHFWWAVPLSVAGLPAFFAIYYGIATMLAWRLGLKGISGAVTFGLLWFLADYARGHMFTGFPWNLEGYAWTGMLPMLQITSAIGIYGLTLITILAACLPACLVSDTKSARYVMVTSLLVLIAIGAWGSWRLSDHSPMTDAHLRIVQPNIEQAHKWDADEREDHFQRLLDLSFAPSIKAPTAIIWPETASTFYLLEDDIHRRVTASHIAAGTSLITGVIRREADVVAGTVGPIHYYNSLIAIDSQDRITALYDKFHLVPFGEYIPVREFLPIRTLAGIGVDFSSGDGPHTLHTEGLPSFSPFVCYEAIFPGDVVSHSDRPQLLVNVTNDGWYAKTAGPYQHFANARVRAIEEGLPLARAANTGISGMIDPYGRVIAKIELGETGFVDTGVPQALRPTLFSRVGEKTVWALFGILLASVIFYRLRKKHYKIKE